MILSIENSRVRQHEVEIGTTFLFANGDDFADEDELSRLTSSEDIVNRILSSDSCWGIVYYRNDLNLLFIGRDVFGRTPLLWTKSNNELHFAELVDFTIGQSWCEVPHAQVTVVDLPSMKAEMFSLIDNYPEEMDISPWRTAFASFQSCYNPMKHTLLEVNREVIAAHMADFPQTLIDKLIKASKKLVASAGEPESIAVMFSGGVDSLLVAHALHAAVDANVCIELVNVAFGDDDATCSSVPDRKRGTEGYAHLTSLYPERKFIFVRVDVGAEELSACRMEHISKVAAPAVTVLDDSLACVLWFALRGQGATNGEPYTSRSTLAFVGSGADELFAGYRRHRTRFEKDGASSVAEECEHELIRLGVRNGGRDGRVACHLKKRMRAPFLEDIVVEWANALPVEAKCDLSLPRGVGEKRIIRQALALFGAPHTAPKQAMQFGSRMAKMSMGIDGVKTKGHQQCQHLTLLP